MFESNKDLLRVWRNWRDEYLTEKWVRKIEEIDFGANFW